MKHRLEYALVKLLLVVIRVVPDSLVRASGTLLGLAFYTLDRAHRRIAQRNLASAFPSRTERERRAIARAWRMRRVEACCSSRVTSVSGSCTRSFTR